jgi:tRNA(Arg) A34 adenosine deaminase TadA
MDFNKAFLREAIRLSEESVACGGGPFGAVVVQSGRIIARSWNRVTTANDPTAHAEILAIREACAKLETFSLEGCSIYASCEPCPMCLAAIYWARIDALYFAGLRADAAAAGFDDALLYEEVVKEPMGRKLKTGQDLRGLAQTAFALWTEKADRKNY